MSPNAQQTASALVDLARAIAATSEADTYDDGTPMPPSVTLHRPSAAVVELLADIGRYGSREDRSYDRGWNAVIDGWKPSDREDDEASRGDHEREMRRERDLGGEG